MFSAIYAEDASEEARAIAFQALVNSGEVWKLEGSMGRAAMGAIEAGTLMLGREATKDYWGNLVPSRTMVRSGTKGSFAYVAEIMGTGYALKLARVS